MKNVEFLRIESLLESIGLKQIAVEPSPDPELGFRMWGGKDALGVVTRWLAKNKPGLLFSLRLSSLSGNGTVVAKIDNNGNIIKESLTSADVPDHNELEGLQGGNSTERYHLTLVEKNNLHSPLALASNDGPLTLDAQTIGFLFGDSLQLVDGALQVNTGNIDHGSFSGLGDDDHTQYVPVNAVRGFSAPVSGQVPTLGSHLTTKDYVDAMTSGSTDFQSSVKNFSDSIPVSPELGDRYIVNDADAWAPHPLQAIVEFDGTDWLDKWIPTQPGATGARVFVEDENVDYRFTGTVWQKVPQVTLHSELLNLQNDDHPQYPREDGSRGFSQPVSGQTPTADAHLATKGYTDSLIAPLVGSFYTGVVDGVLPELTTTNFSVITPACVIQLHDNQIFYGKPSQYAVESAELGIPDDGQRYFIVVSQMYGQVFINLEIDVSTINMSNKIPLYCVSRIGNTIHSISFGSLGLGLPQKNELALLRTMPYRISTEGGLTLSEDGYRHIQVTAALVFAGTTPIDVLAYTSTLHAITECYHDNGIWRYTRTATEGMYDNTTYDDGINKVQLSPQKFKNLWVFRTIGNDREVYYINGTNEYSSISQALGEKLQLLPPILTWHGKLVGRIIVQNGASSGEVFNITESNQGLNYIPQLTTLSDVYIDAKQYRQTLMYNDATRKWENRDVFPLAVRGELSGTLAVNPITYDVFGQIGTVTFVLNPPTRLDVVNEYHFSFIAGPSTYITWPAEIKWAGGISPTIVNGVTYEVTICNNCGICVGFA